MFLQVKRFFLMKNTRKLFSESNSNFFTHHLFRPYYMLVKKYYFQGSQALIL